MSVHLKIYLDVQLVSFKIKTRKAAVLSALLASIACLAPSLLAYKATTALDTISYYYFY